MPKRKLKDWITSYLKYTQHQESPEVYHLFTAISVLASALARKVTFSKGYYTIFTNLYISLVGPSAIVSKSTAAEIGIGILKQALPETQLIEEKATPWAIYDWLAKQTEMKGTGILSVFASEMKTLLNESFKEEMVPLLTSLYGCPESAPYVTKTKTDIINYVYLNILCCSTPEWLMTGITSDDLGGGFTGRWLYVYADHSPRSEPFPEDGITEDIKQLRDDLIHDLAIIGDMSGEFTMDDKAKEYYRVWYETRKNEWSDERLFGYYNRKRETVYKLAMILELATADTLIITEEKLKVAFMLLSQIEEKMGQAFSGVTFSESLKFQDKLLEFVEKKQVVSLSETARRFRHYLDAEELNITLDNLILQERIAPMTIMTNGKRIINAR